jgi:hypothetical protein
MTTFALFFVLAAVHAQTPETRRVPADSVEIAARGCLQGRVFTATPRPEDEGVILGPDVTGWNFRVSGPRAVLDQVRKYNGNLVEVVGLVKKSALTRPGPGSGSRVTMTAPRTDPTRNSARTMPAGGLPVMDLTAVRYLSDVCPVKEQPAAR